MGTGVRFVSEGEERRERERERGREREREKGRERMRTEALCVKCGLLERSSCVGRSSRDRSCAHSFRQ